MPSEHKLAACAGKKRYRTAHKAYEQKQRLEKRRSRSGGWKAKDTFGGRQPIHPYKCLLCHGWHIGGG